MDFDIVENPYAAAEDALTTTAEAECKICGKLFTVTRPNRLYCDDCSADSDTKKREYSQNLRRNLRNYYNPKVVTCTCSQCGKEYQTIRKLIFSIASPDFNHMDCADEDQVFCRDSCRVAFKKEHALCLWCGKSLKNSEMYQSVQKPDSRHQFCDAECKGAYEWEQARKSHRIVTCEYCKKEFINPSATTVRYFCSRDCSQAARKEGWLSPEARAKKEEEERSKGTFLYRAECPVCFKQKEFRLKVGTTPKTWVCCEDHKRIYLKRKQIEKQRAEQSEDEKWFDQLVKTGKYAEVVGMPKEIGAQSSEIEPLCATCKVSYKDCVRMQTNFRVLPKGAKYNENGILTVCPDFKEV